jgi:nitroreductase
MDFFQVVETRHSIRAFSEKPVEEKKVQSILETINRAPSAGNLQAFEVYVVTADRDKARLTQAASDQEFIRQASLVLVFCAHPARSAVRYHQRGENLYAVQDATIACTFAMLAATALGLSSVWVGAFDEQIVSQIIGSPDGQIPVVILPIGEAAETPRIRPRRNLDDLVHPL